MSDTGQILSNYLKNNPFAQRAAIGDPQFSMQVTWLRGMLASMEDAMRAEGIPRDTCGRITTRILYGTVDPQEAISRIEQQNALIEQLRTIPIHPERMGL